MSNINESIVANLNNIGGKNFALIPISSLEIDTGYQRRIKSKIKKMIRDWNYELCDVIIVSYRDGKFYVVDGQHRVEAAKQQKVDPDLTYLPCQVLLDMTREEEARRFLALNTSQTSASPHDTWNANLLLNDPTDMAIDRICRKWNIVVSDAYGNRAARLGDLQEARTIVRSCGAFAFDWILETLHEAQWNLSSGGHSSNILRALKAVYKENAMTAQEAKDAIIDIIKGKTPSTLRAEAVHKYGEYDIKTALQKYLLDMVAKKIAAKEMVA